MHGPQMTDAEYDSERAKVGSADELRQLFQRCGWTQRRDSPRHHAAGHDGALPAGANGGLMTKAKQLKSFREDTAVRDNAVESWLCVDCHVNTAPGLSSGPEIRVAFALGTKELTQTFTFDSEVYHVKDTVWEAAGMKPWGGCLCVGCLEQRLGRQLRPKDFSRHDQTWVGLPASDRLLDRRGLRRIKVRTKDGEEEIIIDKKVADEMAKHLAPGELPYAEADEE